MFRSLTVRLAIGLASWAGAAGAEPARTPPSEPTPGAPAEPRAPAVPAEPAEDAAPGTEASSDDLTRARIDFDAALELARAGDYPSACNKLEQSLAAHDGLGTSFHLAGCWLKIGKTASAYALFGKIAERAHELGQPEREQVVRARMEALLPRLSRLRIDVPSPEPGLEVRRDGAVVPEAEWGKPVAVDRGSHEIRVTAPREQPWTTTLDVNEPATTLVVQVPALELTPEPAAASPAARLPEKPRAVASHRVAAAPTETPPDKGGPSRTVAIVVGSLGVAALGAGVLEGARYLDQNREAKSICPSGVNCTADEIQRHDKAVDAARNARTWAYVGASVGGVTLAVATYLFVAASHGSRADGAERATGVRLEPLADGRGTFGGALVGRF